MKKSVILLFLLWHPYVWAQNGPQVYPLAELYIAAKNVPSQNELTFTLQSQGPVWDSTYYLSTIYPGGTVDTYGATFPAFYAGYDFTGSTDWSCNCSPTCCYGGTIAFGMYKVSCSDGGYFYLDYTDDAYGRSYAVGLMDVWILYDDSENEFYWSSDHTGGNLGTFTRITNGNTVGVWTMYGYSSPQDQSKFQPTTPTNLQVTWNSDYTHPFLQWDASSPYLAALYDIYRRTRNGSYQQIASNYGSTTYLDTQVGCGLQTYYYKVIAVSGDGSKQSPSYIEKSFSATCAAPIGEEMAVGSSHSGSENPSLDKPSSAGSRGREPMNVYSSWVRLQLNDLACFVANDGEMLYSNIVGEFGLVWVSQGGKTLAQAPCGLWVAGKDEDGLKRNGIVWSGSDCWPGVLTQSFADTNFSAASDPLDKKFQISVLSDTSSPSDTSYQRWVTGASITGAPLNEDGTPKLFGSTNAYWVMNDLDTSANFQRGTSPPMGLEIHSYVFGIDTIGVLSDAMFIMLDVINKSIHTYDSTYFGWFSDIDIGYPYDDLPGCDTLLSLGYMYNGQDTDAVFGSAPPACGFVILEAPAKTSSNAPMCSFSKDVGAGYVWGLYPNGASPTFSQQIINDLSGKHRNGVPFINPDDSAHIISFVDPGDPVTGAGWIASQEQSPSDSRFLQGSGPFTFTPGESEQFVVAFIAARDTSRLSSITKLKESVPVIVSKWNEIKSELVSVDVPKPSVPTEFAMSVGYPNPFNPSTNFRVTLPTRANVEVTVYDILGREIKTLKKGDYAAGSYSVTWDGRNDAGMTVSSGVYFCVMRIYSQQGKQSNFVRKVALLK